MNEHVYSTTLKVGDHDVNLTIRGVAKEHPETGDEWSLPAVEVRSRVTFMTSPVPAELRCEEISIWDEPFRYNWGCPNRRPDGSEDTRYRERPEKLEFDETFGELCTRIEDELHCELDMLRSHLDRRREMIALAEEDAKRFFSDSRSGSVDPFFAAMTPSQRERYDEGVLPDEEVRVLIGKTYLDRFGEDYESLSGGQSMSPCGIGPVAWEKWKAWVAAHPIRDSETDVVSVERYFQWVPDLYLYAQVTAGRKIRGDWCNVRRYYPIGLARE